MGERPVLMGPGDNMVTEVTADTPTFMWFGINGNGDGETITYILTLLAQGDNNSWVVVWQPNTTETTLAYNGPALELGKTYAWSVKAHNVSNMQSENSETHRFIKRAAVRHENAEGWCEPPAKIIRPPPEIC